MTTGNHVWDQRETLIFIERHDRLLRPINFPKGAPGRGAGLFKAANGADVLVINAMGRVFMGDLDYPFRAVDAEIEACGLKRGADAILIDFHAEATSEKQALGYFVDGRASAVIGTHTHVPTADEQVLNGGTAYISDAGMCGDYDSVLGMNKEEPLSRFLTKIPNGRFQPALGEATHLRRRHRDRRRNGPRQGHRADQARRQAVAGRARVLGARRDPGVTERRAGQADCAFFCDPVRPMALPWAERRWSRKIAWSR